MSENADSISRGFTTATVDAQRYGNYDSQPFETPGIVQTLIPQRSRVLDVGCGNGQLSGMLMHNRNCDVVGIEPHAERASVGIQRGLNIINGLFTAELAQTLGKFDIVLFGDVLEHLADPTELLLLCHRVLRPGGSVVVSVPNVAHWAIRTSLLRGRFDYAAWGPMDATHLRWFTWKSLDLLLTTAGFSVTDRTASAGTWLPLYSEVFPWSKLSPRRREQILIRMTRKFPKLFGCQLVFKATSNPVAANTDR